MHENKIIAFLRGIHREVIRLVSAHEQKGGVQQLFLHGRYILRTS